MSVEQLADKMEKAMIEAVAALPEVRTVEECEWVEALCDAAEEIRMKTTWRLTELDEALLNEGDGDG